MSDEIAGNAPSAFTRGAAATRYRCVGALEAAADELEHETPSDIAPSEIDTTVLQILRGLIAVMRGAPLPCDDDEAKAEAEVEGRREAGGEGGPVVSSCSMWVCWRVL